MASLTPHRQSSFIRNLRQTTPYVNFYHGASHWTGQHAHPTPRDPLSSQPNAFQQRTWTAESERGSRHCLDTAPFSLWDAEKRDYREPTNQEGQWIVSKYKATSLQFVEPFVVVTTKHVASTEQQHDGMITLTIGCAPALFISPETDKDGFAPGPPRCNALWLCNPNLEDPLVNIYQATSLYSEPTGDEVALVFNELAKFCSVQALNFIFPKMIVELLDNGREYVKNSLPTRVGRWATHYHIPQNGVSYWNSTASMARMRETSAHTTNGRGDETNYLTHGNRILGPGVRVEGSTMASTAGVRIRNGAKVRITVAAHSFDNCARVFHPDGDRGDLIAEIKERYERQDWALAELVPSAPFNNSQIFELPTPQKLLSSREMKGHEWYVCDGMTTGKIALLYSGARWLPDSDETTDGTWVSQFTPESVYYAVGPASGTSEIKEGICGAAIIHESAHGVGGFFHLIHDHGYCFSARLDRLIEDGWACY